MKRGATIIVSYDGPLCRRCGEPMDIREHEVIGERERRQPFYFSRWYCCTTDVCPTGMVMPRAYKVWNDNEAARRLRGTDRETARRLEAIKHQLSPTR